jgi:hypothetical protein
LIFQESIACESRLKVNVLRDISKPAVFKPVRAARVGLDRHFRFYSNRRPHGSLDRRTLDQFYFESTTRGNSKLGQASIYGWVLLFKQMQLPLSS